MEIDRLSGHFWEKRHNKVHLVCRIFLFLTDDCYLLQATILVTPSPPFSLLYPHPNPSPIRDPPPPQLYYSLMFFFFFLFSSPNRIIQLFPNFCFLYQRLREQKAIISLNHLSKKKKNEGKRKMKANLQYFVSFFFFFLFISFVLFCMRIYRRLSFL